MTQNIFDDESTYGLGNGLVAVGTKPLLEPMLTQVYAVIWRH